MKKTTLWLFGFALSIVLGVAVVGLVGSMGSTDEEETIEETVAKKPAARRCGYVRPSSSNKSRGKKPEIVHSDDEPELSEAEERLLAEIADALDREDFKQACGLYAAARKSDKSEIRRAMVETLGWFGPEALPELTEMLSDRDEDVLFEVTAQWQSALYELEEDREKAPVIEKALMSDVKAETLEEIANELHGMDELLALHVISNVIADGAPANVKAAKEAYELVTGDPWTGVDDAEKWLQENYEQSTTDESIR